MENNITILEKGKDTLTLNQNAEEITLSPLMLLEDSTSSMAIEAAQKQDPSFNLESSLFDGAIGEAFQGNTNDQNTLGNMFSWHNTQTLTEDNSSQNTASALPLNLVSSSTEALSPVIPFQNNFQDFQPYTTYDTLDLNNFEHPTSNKVEVFYEKAVDTSLAEAVGLDKELDYLSNFSYENIQSDTAVVNQIVASGQRLIQEEKAVLVETPPIVIPPVVTPPVAEPNNYSFDTGIVNTAPEASGTVLSNFQGINIITNPIDDTMPANGTTNLVDSDPHGEALTVSQVTNAALTIAGNAIELTALTGPLASGEVAQYSFTYQDHPATLIVLSNGGVEFSSQQSNYFGTLELGQNVDFSFDYTVKDTQGLTSNLAHVDLTLNGSNHPTGVDDAVTFNESQVTGASVEAFNILSNDSSPESYPLSVEQILTTQTGAPTDPKFAINGVSMDLTSITPSDSSMVAEYTFTYNNQVSDLAIYKSGDVKILPYDGETIFSTLHKGDTAELDFYYQNTDGVATSTNPIHSTITINGEFTPPVAEPNSYTFNVNITDQQSNDEESNLTDFNRLNIITDPVNTSNPADPITNPVDSDAQGESLTLSQITHATLMIAGQDYALTLADPSSVAEGVLAHYNFTYEGFFASLSVYKDGTVQYQTYDGNIFDSLEQSQNIVFTFDYRVTDTQGLESNSAPVSITLEGHLTPTAVNDSTLISVQGLSAGTSQVLDIFQNDIDANYNPLRVEHIFASGENSNYSGPTLEVNGQNYALTLQTSMDPNVFAEYTATANSVTGTFDISKEGEVSITNGPNFFASAGLTNGESAQLNFYYTNADQYASSPTPALASIDISGSPLPPVVEPNYYNFNSDVTNTTPDNSGNYTTNFNGLNIINDLEYLTQPANQLTNPVDYDPQHTLLTVQGISSAYLTFNDNYGSMQLTLTPSNSLPVGSVAQYSFTYDSNVGTFTILANGSVEFESSSENFFNQLEVSQSVVFGFSYAAIDTYNQTSTSEAYVSIALNGTNHPTGIDDFVTLTANQVQGASVDVGNILANDQSPNGSLPFVNQILTTQTSGVPHNPEFTFNGQATPLTTVPFTDSNVVAEYSFTYNNQVSELVINKNGEVDILPANGSEVFSSLSSTDTAVLDFYYQNNDGVTTSTDPIHANITITADSHAPVIDVKPYGDGGIPQTDELAFGNSLYQPENFGHINLNFTDPNGEQLSEATIHLDPNSLTAGVFSLESFRVASTPNSDGSYQITTPGYTALSIKGLGTTLSNSTDAIDIKGTDTEAHYQDVVDNLHLSSGTPDILMQIYDEQGLASSIAKVPYTNTSLTPVNTLDVSNLQGDQYIHVTDNTLVNPTIFALNSADDIIEVSVPHSTIDVFNGNNQIISTGGSSTINGGHGNDAIYTSGGNNTINVPSTASDFIAPGPGINTLNFDSYSQAPNTIFFSTADIGTGPDVINNFAIIPPQNDPNFNNDIVRADFLDLSDILNGAGYKSGVSNISQFVQITEGTNGNATVKVDPDGQGFVALATLIGIHTGDVIKIFDEGNHNQLVSVHA